MARTSCESLNEPGIFPTSWVTLDLAKNHEGLENTEQLAVEIAKLMTRRDVVINKTAALGMATARLTP
jgi:hypothetical protein